MTLRIPNLIVLAILALFVAFAAVSWGHIQMWMHLASGGLVLAAGLLMYARQWWGAGDAKLALAGALWVPIENLPQWLLATVLAGGALTLLLLIIRRLIPEAKESDLAPVLRRRGPIPYGMAIAFGTVLASLPLQTKPAPAIVAPEGIVELYKGNQ